MTFLVRATCLLLALFCTPAWGAEVPVPIATDSRIKTFVYSENDVFTLVTYYGYQSNIEFGLHEEIETISAGERTGWQIIPAGRRLFIRAMMTSAHTNMTVVTNKHTYQFDLIAVPTPQSPNEELAYVVRFYYPGDKKNTSTLPYSDMAYTPDTGNTNGGYNYHYTYTGNEAVAPVKLFDDGAVTYFKFNGNDAPVISVVGAGGAETRLTPRRSGEYWVVDVVAARFNVLVNGQTIHVFNEKLFHS